MYVRWKKKVRRKETPKASDKLTLCGYVVESYREDKKVKQKVITYLGSIRQEWIRYPHIRKSFWTKAQKRLTKVNLPEKSLAKISSQIHKVIPRPEM